MKKARLDLRRTCRLIRGCGYAVPTPVRCWPPEEKIQKDYYLRPPWLRRRTAARKTASSGEQSLAGIAIAGTILFSGKGSPPGRGFPAGGNHPKNHYLRPLRLRRSSADRNASSSGEHSLAGTEIAGTTLFSGKGSPPGRGFPAGGGHPKKLSPPTTSASPEFGRRKIAHLRPAFASRR